MNFVHKSGPFLFGLCMCSLVPFQLGDMRVVEKVQRYATKMVPLLSHTMIVWCH